MANGNEYHGNLLYIYCYTFVFALVNILKNNGLFVLKNA